MNYRSFQADGLSLPVTATPQGKPAMSATLSLLAAPSELGKLRGFLSDYCSQEKLPDHLSHDLEIILEELATNVMKYAGVPEGSECCLIELDRKTNDLTIRFSDNGHPFNPLEQTEVDTNLPIEERPIGGLGIHFIKKLTDAQRYERRDGRNVITLTKVLRS